MFTEQKFISAFSHSDDAYIKLPFRCDEKKE